MHLTVLTDQFMKNIKVRQVYPSHCTEQDAICAFKNELKTFQVKTGQRIKI